MVLQSENVLTELLDVLEDLEAGVFFVVWVEALLQVDDAVFWRARLRVEGDDIVPFGR
jgi:hypothetical protein